MSCKLMNCRYQRPEAVCRVFCFPWAGGGSNFYANWGSAVNESVEIVGVTLAGRESRFAEPPAQSMDDLAECISSSIRNKNSDKPFALFGHSMGALLAFETAKILKQKYHMEPVKMYVSGTSGPKCKFDSSKRVTRSIAQYSDQDVIEYLRKMGGTPEEVLNNKEMMSVILPVLKADYSIMDAYSCNLPEGGPMLSCPVDLFDGEDDIKHDLESWKLISSGKFQTTFRDGGHFYLKTRNNMEYFQNLLSTDLPALCSNHELSFDYV